MNLLGRKKKPCIESEATNGTEGSWFSAFLMWDIGQNKLEISASILFVEVDSTPHKFTVAPEETCVPDSGAENEFFYRSL